MDSTTTTTTDHPLKKILDTTSLIQYLKNSLTLRNFMSQPILLLVILIEGFITISAEILTIRQLLPVVGSSVIVTSLIIGVFLLFLAYGYRRGGQYTENFSEKLKQNFTFSAVWMGVGLSYLFIYLFFVGFRRYFDPYILWALSAYLLIITAPLVYVLGQTVPITMNMVKQTEMTGAIGGKILHLSTVGSFLGAVITSLLLMNYFGVAWTVFINCVLLAFLTLILFSELKKDIFKIVILLITLGFVFYLNISLEKQMFVATNAYANYEVMSDANGKMFISNGSATSYLTNQNKGFPYVETIKRILFFNLKMRDKDILVLGAGGFTLSADKIYQNHFVYVDIDKDLKDIVEKNFSPKIKGEFVVEDARNYLAYGDKKFDAIVSDAYSNIRSIPSHLLTQEYFRLVNQRLRDNGVAIFNIIARPTLEDSYSKRLDNTIRSVFSHCMVIPTKYSSEIANIIYTCQKNPEQDNIIYTDNMNRSTLDFFKSIPD